MLFKVCQGAGVVLALSAGPVLADDTVEHVFFPSADSYQHWANEPHGDAPFLEMYEIITPHREGVAMMAFDLSALAGVDSENLIAAQLQLFPFYSGQTGNFSGDQGVISVMKRASAFDELDPNPGPDSIGDVLAELTLDVGSLDPFALATAGLLDEVRDWTVNPDTNYGLDIYLRAVAGADASFYLAIHSSEAVDADFQPRLVVTEQIIPLPGTSVLLLAGALRCSRRRR